MLGKRLIKSNDAGGGACTNTVDLYNPFPDGGGVALYQLNGDANDVSGNYDGTASNVTYGTGQFGQAGVFNGSSSYISGLPTLTNISASYSISVWAKFTSTPSSNAYIFGGIKEQGSSDSLIGVFVNTSNNIVFRTRGSNVGTINDIVASSNYLGQWHNIVVTQDSLKMELFIDGASIGTLSVSPTITLDNCVIGASNGRGTIEEYFAGSIDQVRIFNRALRPYEVEALYTEEYCTPTIVPSEHFNTVLYTGTGATNPVTGVGFQPDFVWLKKRSGVDDHFIFDSIRGAKSIYPNLTNAEDSFTFSFDTDGFTVPVSGGTNGNGDTFVAWNFKAGGAAVTNTDGTITSQVSVNTEAGFSIVSWTGSGSAANIGHGLNDVPSVVIVKNRDRSPTNWPVYHVGSVFGGTTPQETVIYLNVTNSNSDNSSMWNDTAPTSSVFTVNTNEDVNFSGNKMIAYCFAEVEGFSNFGSYVGTGTTSGPTVITGFEPAFVMIKRTDAPGFWTILDNKRDTTNPNDKALYANASNAESTAQATNFYENGFQPVTTDSDVNANGTYIYMAFAADPTAVEPTLEDSFNTVLYTGNGTTNPITGVGLQPDFTWIKNRSIAQSHHLIDSVRGTTFSLNSNQTAAEVNRGSEFSSFDSDGFTLGSGGNMNNNGNNYVAWNWKGAEIPAINSNGSIPSVVSANPAAGFSIVKYQVTGSSDENKTVGHGLNSVPKVIIIKGLDYDVAWVFHTTAIDGSFDFLRLNTTQAANPLPLSLPTSSVFTNGYLTASNYIAYCFAEVAGFSKFGSYTGNGLPLGPSIDLGFEPAFVMYKCTTQVGNWIIVDNKRAITNPRTPHLRANSSSADDFGAGEYINFIANGFQPSGVSNFNNNSNGQTYIYMAFANQF